MSLGRSEPIHFGFRFDTQYGWKPKVKHQDTEDNRSTTIYTSKDSKTSLTLSNEHDPLLRYRDYPPSKIAPGAMVICDDKHNHNAIDRHSTSRHSQSRRYVSRRFDPLKSRVAAWTKSVLPQYAEYYGPSDMKDDHVSATSSWTTVQDKVTSGECVSSPLLRSKGYRSPYVSEPSAGSAKNLHR